MIRELRDPRVWLLAVLLAIFLLVLPFGIASVAVMFGWVAA